MMKRLIAFALTLITIATLTTHITTAQTASAADKPPRKVVTGWLPYYSVRTIMPLVRKLPTAQQIAVYSSHGTLIEAYTFMKGEGDLVANYTQRFTEAMSRVKNFGESQEVTDAYRTGLIMREKT